jgi:hypothetical protein
MRIRATTPSGTTTIHPMTVSHLGSRRRPARRRSLLEAGTDVADEASGEANGCEETLNRCSFLGRREPLAAGSP